MKAYRVDDHDNDEMGIAVIAENAKIAKSVGYAFFVSEGWDVEYINIRCKLIKNANIDGMPAVSVVIT